MLADFFPNLLVGAWMTIQIALLSLVIGIILGLGGALVESSRYAGLRWFFTGLITLFRGLPELVIIFLIYLGGSEILNRIAPHTISLSPYIAGSLALGFIFAAYASQTFRGAFAAIPEQQREAGLALGMRPTQIFWRILFPQVWRYALPGLSNQWLVLLKDTALVSLIGLSELTQKAQNAAATTHEPLLFYMTAALLYLGMTLISQIFLTHAYRRSQREGALI